MLHALVVIVTTHYTIFVFPRLLICLTKHTFGLALFLPGQNPGSELGMPMASRTLRTGTKRAVFMSFDTRGYIRKYCHWTGLWEEYLCRRKHLSPLHGTVQKNHKKKKQMLSRSWPYKATTDDEHCTKFSSVHEHGYRWIHWISPPMDRVRIVLLEKITENAPLATLSEEEAQEKTGSWWRPPTWSCPKEQEKIHLLTGPFDLVLQVFFSRNWVGKFLSEPELVRKKEQKNKNSVFFEIVLPSLARKTSQGKWWPTLRRDR